MGPPGSNAVSSMGVGVGGVGWGRRVQTEVSGGGARWDEISFYPVVLSRGDFACPPSPPGLAAVPGDALGCRT